jgi:alpha-galactosidase
MFHSLLWFNYDLLDNISDYIGDVHSRTSCYTFFHTYTVHLKISENNKINRQISLSHEGQIRHFGVLLFENDVKNLSDVKTFFQMFACK